MIDTSTMLEPATVSSVEPLEIRLEDGAVLPAETAVPYSISEGDRVLVAGKDRYYVIGLLKVRDLTIAAEGKLRLSGREVEIEAGVFGLVADRVVQKARRFYQWVEGLFDLRSRRMRTDVETTYRLTADRATVRGSSEVTVGGSNINLG